MQKTVVNSVYDQLPETPCIFKPIGVSKHQDVVKLLRGGELLKLDSEDENISIRNLAHQKIGHVPPYLEAVLKPHIDATPEGFYYAKVKALVGKQTVGVWCTLLESPTLPEFLTSGDIEMSSWYGKVAGVTFEDRQRWWEKIEEDTLLEGSYPHITMQKEDSNPADSNALKILAYFPVEGWQHLGYVGREDAKEIRLGAHAGMRFYTRLISVGKTKQGDIGGIIEIVGMTGTANGFEALS